MKSKYKYRNYTLKIKYNPKKNKKKSKNIEALEKNEEFSINEIFLNSSSIFSRKCQSLIIENNKIIDELNIGLYNEDEIQNMSDEYNEDKIIKSFKTKMSKIVYDKKIKPEITFDQLVKAYQNKYNENEKMDNYYNYLFSKYASEPDDELIDINIFGLNFKIKNKIRQNFYNKFITEIKKQNKINREQKENNLRLSLIIDKFKKKKNNDEAENKNIKKYKKRKTQTYSNNKNSLFLRPKKQEELVPQNRTDLNASENEYKQNFFWGVKIDSVKELEKKKEEVLLRLKHDVKYKIQEGIINKSEMDNFIKFQKRINELNLEGINNRVYIKQLEQGFNNFEEELKMNEEKRKNERRINNFIDSMNFDLNRGYEIKRILEKTFSHAIDFKNMNYINILSPVRTNENKKIKI